MTNNFTKRNQSTEETTGEIIDIVNTCRRKCAVKVFVSSITCRPKYQSEVKKVNDLLKYYPGIYNFEYIDNSCIKPMHINGDGVHLHSAGIDLLADKYLACINIKPILQFQSLWD